MAEKTSLASQAGRLLSNLSEHGTAHLAEVESDLLQTTALLREAIDSLSASFIAVNDALQAQDDTVDRMLSGAVTPAEARELLAAGRSDIALRVNAAITALQFQDMTSQLIERATKRANGLRDAFAPDALPGPAACPRDDDDAGALLALVNDRLESQCRLLEGSLRKSVAQTRLESGDIELF